MVRVCLVCKTLTNCLPKWLYHFAFLLAVNESSCCCSSSLVFDVVRVLDFVCSNRCIVVSHCFNLHFSEDIYDVKQILICHLCIFFSELSIKVFCPVFNWVVCFLMVDLDQFFIYFD